MFYLQVLEAITVDVKSFLKDTFERLPPSLTRPLRPSDAAPDTPPPRIPPRIPERSVSSHRPLATIQNNYSMRSLVLWQVSVTAIESQLYKKQSQNFIGVNWRLK